MILLFLIFVSLIVLFVQCKESSTLHIIHEVINQTIFDEIPSIHNQHFSLKDMPYYFPLKSNFIPSRDYTTVMKVCQNANEADSKRSVCCTPHDVRHLYNVQIQNGKLVYFIDPMSFSNPSTDLPPVSSVKQHNQMDFNMNILQVKGKITSKGTCQKYFDGTLHVIGRSTVKNVYHAIGDNVLTLISQIILDAYLYPDMLYKPRMLLIGFTGTGPVEEEEGAPHMRLIRDLMSDGVITLEKASGMCFRRISWGHGPHIFYVDSLQVLRRQVAKFARLFVEKLLKRYKQKVATSFENRWGTLISDSKIDHRRLQLREGKAMGGLRKQNVKLHRKPIEDEVGQLKGGQNTRKPNNEPTAVNVNMTYKGNGSLLVDNRPMRVVLYTRGSSGRGRTIQNELLLVQAFKERGAEAFICCDFGSTSLEQQLYYAYHADLIIGLHGAAIMHGVFMPPGSISLELKTLYAYEANLFGLVGESRYGIHSQVDIRKYFIPGGHRPIDGLLLDRIFKTLDAAILMQRKLMLHDYSLAEFSVRNRTSKTSENPVDELCQHSTLINVLNALPGDFVFGPSCPPPTINHILGPTQDSQTAVCKSLIFQKMREQIGVKGESFHCQICAPFVGQ